MVDDKKNLGELLAVDMPNGFTYIGRGHEGSNPLLLKESLALRTESIVSSVRRYKKTANEVYTNYKEENLEKEIRIDNPGPIHFLEQ